MLEKRRTALINLKKSLSIGENVEKQSPEKVVELIRDSTQSAVELHDALTRVCSLLKLPAPDILAQRAQSEPSSKRRKLALIETSIPDEDTTQPFEIISELEKRLPGPPIESSSAITVTAVYNTDSSSEPMDTSD